MDEKDAQALRAAGVVIVSAFVIGMWGLYNGWFPEEIGAPIKAVLEPAAILAVTVTLLTFVLVRIAKSKSSRERERNSVFASFMGANWDGKEGIKITRARSGEVTQVKIKLPPTQPLFDERFRERLTEAAKVRMGQQHVAADPDHSRHSVTFRVLNETQIEELARTSVLREQNSVFASFMGSHWDGIEGVDAITTGDGEVQSVRLTLPPAQPLYDERFREKLTQAARARMGQDHISAEPDLTRHTITFKALTEPQKKELTRMKEEQRLSAAFAPFMSTDWDQQSGVDWGRDPRVTAFAPHGYTTVKVAVAGKWSLVDEEVQKKLRTIAATKLGTPDISESYDAVRNTAEFAVYKVTAEILAERHVNEKIADLEANFRAFFAKPIEAKVHEWDTDTGEPVRFTFSFEPQRGDYLDTFAHKIEQGACRKMGRRMAATLNPKTREIYLEPRTELPGLILHPGIGLYSEQESSRVLIHLGVRDNGEVASWELSATGTQPHAIFAGATRSGKSASMRNVVLGCAWHGIEMICLDPKYKEFLAYQGFPNVRSIATSTLRIIDAIQFVHDRIMEPRYKLAALAKLRGESEPKFPPFVLLIDEYIVLVREMKAWWKANKESKDPAEPPALEMMTKMLVKAAGANVHILMGMQRMDVEFIPGAARDQVGFRLALGQISPALAQMAFENYFAGIGIPLRQGRGLANPDGVLSEVQIYKIDEPSNEESEDQDINNAFLERANELDKTAEWITPKGKFDTDLAAEVDSAVLRAIAEAKNPPPLPDQEALPALIDNIEIPAVSTAVGTIVAGDTIRNPEGQIGVVTAVEDVQDGDEYGVEITALFGTEAITETYTEDSMIDRVDVIPEENKEKEPA